MFVLKHRLLSVAALSVAVMLPRGADAQTSTMSFCTPGALADCAIIRLTQQLGLGIGGTNLFQIAIENLGSPSVPTSIVSLILSTGHAGTGSTDVPATPTAAGGASVLPGAADWDLADNGSLIFLQALDNNGIGGCSAATPVDDGFGGSIGQMGQTCGTGQFITFEYSTPNAFNLNTMSVNDIEVFGFPSGAATASDLSSDRCGVGSPCVTPEPASMVLVLTGFSGLFALGLRRRSASGSPKTNAEA